MQLKLSQNTQIKEPEISITYADMTDKIERIAAFVRTVDFTIRCKADDGEEYYISAADVYYLESVDKKCFVYCKENVYQTEYRLYELEERLEDAGFVRINKSCILNSEVLDVIKPLLNSRLEATLHNGEKLFITRKYLRDIKRILQSRCI